MLPFPSPQAFPSVPFSHSALQSRNPSPKQLLSPAGPLCFLVNTCRLFWGLVFSDPSDATLWLPSSFTQTLMPCGVGSYWWIVSSCLYFRAHGGRVSCNFVVNSVHGFWFCSQAAVCPSLGIQRDRTASPVTTICRKSV